MPWMEPGCFLSVDLALGDRVWLRGGAGERCVLLLHGSLGPEEEDGGQRQRGVSGQRGLRFLGWLRRGASHAL
jgi:hypothetical protein